jgi:sulfur-oxidizing protein SoxX
MRAGEKGILATIALVSVSVMIYQGWNLSHQKGKDPGIPFYSTAPKEMASRASELYRRYNCRDCHSLWGVRNIMQAVPAPALDGIGSWRDEQWLFDYFSAKDPQTIVPSRLKPRFRMPSFADIPVAERHLLAKYFASLKVKDWYLQKARKAEYEKLTGKDYKQ